MGLPSQRFVEVVRQGRVCVGGKGWGLRKRESRTGVRAFRPRLLLG